MTKQELARYSYLQYFIVVQHMSLALRLDSFLYYSHNLRSHAWTPAFIF